MYKFHLQNCLWLPIEEQIFGAKMATSGKFLEISSLKLPAILHAHRLGEWILGAKMAVFQNFQFHMYKSKKKKFFDSLFSFVLTVVEH